MEERNPFIYIATGQQGGGKSYRTERELEEYIQVHKNRCVIIFDVNNEYTSYKTIAVDITKSRPLEKGSKKKAPNEGAIMSNITSFWRKVSAGEMRPEIRRIVPRRINGEHMTTDDKVLCATLLLKYARNCLVLLEDMHTYMMRAQKADTIGSLLNKRHRNQDIIIHTQSIDRLDPLLFTQTNVLRMHHQPNQIKRIAYKAPNIELLEISKTIVDLQYFQGRYEHHTRFFVYIMDHNSIIIPTQDFPQCKQSKEDMFKEACRDYISKNPKVLKSYLDQIDVNSTEIKQKKIHTPASAQEAYINDRLHWIQ